MSDTLDPKDPKEERRSVVLLSTNGMKTSRECANVLGAIALDVGLGRITPQVANAMCNPIGKMLKLKEMEIKYGLADTDGGPKRLLLTD